MTVTRVQLQTAMRGASVMLLKDYAAAAGKQLQVYRARPAKLYPPTAFVNAIRERITMVGPTLRQRIPTVEVVVVHGIFDSGDTVDSRDEFVDGFLDFMLDQYHAAGPNTLIAGVNTEDDPNYVPDWLPPDQQKQYYATVILLEGYASDA